MAASLQTESKPSSRRALLAGALGGIGAWAAGAIGRASPVRAEGQAVVVGGEYADAASVTKISNLTNSDTVLWGESSSGIGVSGSSSSEVGVSGNSSTNTGVRGQSTSHLGVQGISSTHFGVYGSSSSSNGVRGVSTSAGQAGSVGQAFANSTGVLGFSGAIVPPAAKAKTGMFGYAEQDNFSRGVTGESPAGIGVYGISSTGYGGYFDGKVHTTKWYELSENPVPPAPLANRARLFIKDNGAGKTQLCVRFATGAVQVIASQP